MIKVKISMLLNMVTRRAYLDSSRHTLGKGIVQKVSRGVRSFIRSFVRVVFIRSFIQQPHVVPLCMRSFVAMYS